VAVLVACGGDSLPPDIDKIATSVGCPSPTAYETNDSSIHRALACGDGHRIFTFNSNDDRDNFREKFEQIGATFEEGNGLSRLCGRRLEHSDHRVVRRGTGSLARRNARTAHEGEHGVPD
jgi:hypothetical protein